MSRPQFADRTKWVTCNECDGRSFSDPTKTLHYPTCSKYREWRFGPKAKPAHYSYAEQDRHNDSVLEDFWREYAGGEEW